MDIELVEPTKEERGESISLEEWKAEQVAILARALLEARDDYRLAEGALLALGGKVVATRMLGSINAIEAALRRAGIEHVTMNEDAKG